MNKSDTIGELAKALSKVQGQLKPALKDSQNPFFRSTYADLNSVWDACRDLLSTNGLAVAQVNLPAESGVIIETILMHESGEYLSGELYLPLAKHDPQGVGSAITYGRRYALAAMIGIVSDVDDDGNHASQPTQQKQQAQPSQQRPASAPTSSGGKLSEGQSKAIYAICKSKDIQENTYIDGMFPGVVKGELTMKQASEVIEALNAE